jgi:conjugal transfer ATP-binding protein TraC
MGIPETFNELGHKLMGLFGEVSFGEKGRSQREDREAEELFSKDTLANILPYKAYDDETGVFINKGSLGFVIEATPLIGADDATQKEITSIFQDVMEEGSSVQCLLWADHRISKFLNMWGGVHEGRSSEFFKTLIAKRVAFFEGKRDFSPRIFRFIFSYSIPIQGEFSDVQLRRLKEVKDGILKTLSALTYAFSWDAEDFISTLDGLVNFTHSPQVVKRRWNPYETLSSQIPTGGVLKTREQELVWENSTEAIFRSYRVVDYPEQWTLGAMQALIGDFFRESFKITAPFYLHYGVHCPIQSKVEGSFWKKMQLIENQGKSGFLLRLIPELAEELKEYDFVRRKLNDTRFVWTQLSAGIWSDKESLQRDEQSIKTVFRINQFKLMENRCIHMPQYLSILPMAWGEYHKDLRDLNLLKTTITSEPGNFVPIQGEWLGTPSPGMLLMGRRGQLMNWNPFDNKNGNYNISVVGRSGSGKSVFMQELLMSSLRVGSRVFVLEVGRSFEKMNHAVSGQFIEFTQGSDLCLNPFTCISGEEEERNQSFSMMKSIIATMAAPVKGTSDVENSYIEQAIRSSWESKKNKATVTDIACWLKEQDSSDAKTLGVMLTPYSKGGIYSRYFEGDNNVDFSNPMVLIELEELKEKKDLQAVVLQMFIMTITNQMFLGDRKEPFHICIDEAWDLLRGKQTGEFIETLARRLRKYNGSLVVGTQSVDDFYVNPGALAAFENSDWMCFLSQKNTSIRRLSESNKIEVDGHKRMVLESITTRHGEFSETMICDAEGHYCVARLLLDPFSELLYTTKANEYALVKELQNKGLSVVEAINHVLEIRGKGDERQ